MTGSLQPNWHLVKLGQVCELNPRSRVALDAGMPVSFVPMSAVDEVFGEIVSAEDRPIVEVSRGYTPFTDGDVLFAKITPCMQNGKAAVARNLRNGVGFGSTEFHVLRPKPMVLSEWLFHFVRCEPFRKAAAANLTGTAGQQRVPPEFVANALIPLPPLSEQRRVVEILREAEAVRRLRADADRTTAELIPAIFHELFGDPEANEFRWPTELLSRLGELDRGRSRHRPRDEPSLYGGSYPFIQTGDVANADGWIQQHTQTYSGIGLQQSRLWPANTLCVTIAANIGAAAILTFDACFPDSIVGFTPGPRVTVEFVNWCFQVFRARLEQRAPAGAQKNINLETLRGLRVPVPPLELQREFTRRALEVRSVKQFRSAGGSDGDLLQELLASLLSHAFGGELTAGWRQRHVKKLAEEAVTRDAALREIGAAPIARAPAPEPEREEVEDGRMAELSVEQCKLWKRIPALPFTAASLAAAVPGVLHDRPDAVRRHLEVFCARGLLISVSRKRQDASQRVEFAQLYRKPTEAERHWLDEEMTRLAQSLGGIKQ